MVFKTVCVVCLVLSLLASVDDVSSRPTGLRGDVEGSVKTAVPESLQRKDQVSRPGPVPLGSQRVLSTGEVRNLGHPEHQHWSWRSL